MTRNKKHLIAAAVSLAFAIAALLFALSLLVSPVHAAGGATPGLAKYNAYVVQLHNVGCTPLWVSWGSSYWKCPPNQRWRARYYAATDTATLVRLR